MHNDKWDVEEETNPQGKWLPYAVLFAYLPLGAISGAAHFARGARAYAPQPLIHMLLRFVFHALVIVPVIAWPAVSGEPTWHRSPRKSALAVLLLTAPLLSLAYYLGDIRDLAGFMDAFWAVVPAVAIAVAHFRRSESIGKFVGAIGLATYVCFFVVGDRLGALPSLVAYDSHGSLIYSLRVLSAVAAVALAFHPLPWRRPTALSLALAAVTVFLMTRAQATALAQAQLMACAAATLVVVLRGRSFGLPGRES